MLSRTGAHPNELITLIVQLDVDIILQKSSASVLQVGEYALHWLQAPQGIAVLELK